MINKKHIKKSHISYIILLISTGFLISGSGILNTLISLKLKNIGKSEIFIGKISTIYFIGMLIGALKTSDIIRKLGYKYSFIYLAIATSIVNIIQIVSKSIAMIGIARFIQGFATSVIYVIIDSWIISISERDKIGKNISLYMIMLYLSYAISQYFLICKENIIYENGNISCISTGLIVISIIIMYSYNIITPKIEKKSKISIFNIYLSSKSGFIGCMVSGMMISTILTLMPIYIQKIIGSVKLIGVCMFCTFMSAGLIQYPLGILSDKINKNKIQKIMTIIYIAILICFFFIDYYKIITFNMLLFIISIIGVFSFSMYPISMNLVCEKLKYQDIIEGTQGLTISFGLGSVIGPIYSSIIMEYVGNRGYILSYIIINIVLLYFIVKDNRKINIKQ